MPNTDYERIERAIRFIEAHFQDQPDLREVAKQVHLSEFHFQRLFKRWAGVTPKRFLQFLTVEYAKERLQDSRSILDATIDSGLSSPSRLHDLFVSTEAVTPGEYKSHGADVDISYGFHDSPFGECLLAVTDRGICGLDFVIDGDRKTALAVLRARWKRAGFHLAVGETQRVVQQVFANGTSNDRPTEFKLLLKGTNFQIKVWRALLEIPLGRLASYADVARRIEQPNAARAVGSAIARNSIAVLIPCHRVIRKVGVIHDYRWGAIRKKALVAWEAAQSDLQTA